MTNEKTVELFNLIDEMVEDIFEMESDELKAFVEEDATFDEFLSTARAEFFDVQMLSKRRLMEEARERLNVIDLESRVAKKSQSLSPHASLEQELKARLEHFSQDHEVTLAARNQVDGKRSDSEIRDLLKNLEALKESIDEDDLS